MDRRQFVRMSALSALAAPLREAIAMPTSDVSAMFVTPEEAQVYNMFGGGEAHLLATTENTSGIFWMGRFREDPGFMTNLHYHPHTDEAVYVLEGVLSVYYAEQWHQLGPGTLGVLPRGKPHAQGNRSDEPVHFIGSGTPAGFEKLFPAVDALMKRLTPGTPEFMAEFRKILPSCDIVPLGPAPL